VVRPLLCLKRNEIESYLEEHGLSACLDSSNLVTDMTRNRIRHEILPRMLEINPRTVEAIARTAELLREEFVYALKQPALSSVIPEAGNRDLDKGTVRLSVELLSGCLPGERRRYIREAIGRSRGNLRRITAAHIEAVEGLLGREKSGKRVHLPGGYEAAREFGELIIRQARSEKEPEQREKEQSEWLELMLGGTCQTSLFRLSYSPVESAGVAGLAPSTPSALLDLGLTGERLLVRARRAGDRYQPAGHKRIEKLKNLMIENRIPLSQRRFWPVIINESGEIVWSPGLPVAHQFSAHATTERFAIILAELAFSSVSHRPGKFN
jgi:tRNA(Ile)-lysidine synthase